VVAKTDELARHLRSTAPPWVERVTLPGSLDAPVLPALPPGFVVRVIDGRRARTKAALMKAFARALGFPPHFGANWDALEDALTDLDWLPGTGYVLVVTSAEALLAREPAERPTLHAVLETAGRDWATPRTAGVPRPARPFHVLLRESDLDKGR
jgi:Barstar (barnase inhibitor)